MLTIGHALDPGDVHRVPEWPWPRTGRSLRAVLALIGHHQNAIGERGQRPTELAGLQEKEDDTVWSEKLKSDFHKLGIAAHSGADKESPDGSAGAESSLQSPPTAGPAQEPRCPKGRVGGRSPQDTLVGRNRPRLIRTLKRMCLRRTMC